MPIMLIIMIFDHLLRTKTIFITQGAPLNLVAPYLHVIVKHLIFFFFFFA